MRPSMVPRVVGVGIPVAWLVARPMGMAMIADEGAGLLESLPDMPNARRALVVAGAVVVIGAVAATVRSSVEFALSTLRRNVTVSVEFDSRDESFRWILEWLADNAGAQRCGEWLASAQGKVSHEVQFTPAPGTYWLVADSGAWIFVTRTRRAPSAGSPTGRALETVTVTALGRRRQVLDAFIAEAAAKCAAKDRLRTLIYTGGDHGSWNMAKSRLRRPLHSVILAGDTSERLVRDMVDFLASENWYAQHGVPWKRGYLLHGTPGSGKTSFVTAVAGHLGLNIYALSLGSAGLTDDALQSLLLTVPPHSIVLIEDIEAAFSRGMGGAADAPSPSLLTLSGLLNALDGVSSQDGCLIFLTTNFPQQLPERLVRSGRIDVKVPFACATKEQIRRLWRSFYPQSDDAELENAFVEAAPADVLAMADLQGLLLDHKREPREALRAMRELVRKLNTGNPE